MKHPETPSVPAAIGTVVIGDGWAAMAAVGFLATGSDPIENLYWVTGTGAHAFAPLPTLESGLGAQAWAELARRLGVETGELRSGSFLREFRNKAFREPAWARVVELPNRQEALRESMQACDAQMPPLHEVRFDRPVVEIENQLREALLGPLAGRYTRITGVTLTNIRIEGGQVAAVTLASGQEILCSRLIFADRWSGLSAIAGLPKGLPFMRKRESAGVLQAEFTHRHPMGLGLQEGFFAPLHREAGEESEKQLFGYFAADGSRSYWSLCIPGEEAEDNHSIAKRLRRMKAALDKMFVGPDWLPADAKEFTATVQAERIRFEEHVLLVGDEPVREPVRLPKLGGVAFLTDGYGPAYAFAQAALEADALRETSGEADHVDIPCAPAPERASGATQSLT